MLQPFPRPQRLVTAEFYRTESGNEPVREWLKTLTPLDRQVIGKDVRKVEYGWPLGMPTCTAIGGGLWEVRSSLGNRIARIFFSFVGPRMVLLHGIIKKTRVAPRAELDIAFVRKADLERRLHRTAGAQAR
jgi:phage-related protein